MFRKTYLEVILQRFLLENDGVREKNDFGLRGVQKRQYEGNEMILKKMSHLLHKNWKHVFFAGYAVARLVTRHTKAFTRSF